MSLPRDWHLREIGDMCKLPERQIRPAEFSKYENYVGLEDIESNTGRIIEYRKVTDANLRSSKFHFDDSCVLYGKLRPYLNKVAIPQIAGICSTDIIPLRPISELMLREYLYYFMRTPFFVKVATAKSTGANLPRLSPSSLLKIPIPLPPIGAQRKIIRILEKADKLNRTREQASRLTNKIVRSVFLKMFGPVVSDQRRWPEKQIGEICKVQSGGTPSRHVERYWKHGTIPWLGSAACKDSAVMRAEEYITEEGLNSSAAKWFEPNTVLVALVGATIGKTGLLRFRAATNQNVAGIYPTNTEQLNSIYLFFACQQLYPEFRALSSETFKMANLSFVKSLRIAVPPIEIQREFAEIAERTQNISEMQEQSSQEIAEVFQSLMFRAFRGELSIANVSSYS